MRPADYPLSLYRGDSYHWQFRLWGDANQTAPVDLTGVVAKAEIRDRSGGTAILALTCVITDNVVDVKLPATAWAGWALSSGLWDLQLTYPDFSVVTILAGPVTITADVTDSTAAAAQSTVERPRAVAVR